MKVLDSDAEVDTTAEIDGSDDALDVFLKIVKKVGGGHRGDDLLSTKRTFGFKVTLEYVCCKWECCRHLIVFSKERLNWDVDDDDPYTSSAEKKHQFST